MLFGHHNYKQTGVVNIQHNMYTIDWTITLFLNFHFAFLNALMGIRGTDFKAICENQKCFGFSMDIVDPELLVLLSPLERPFDHLPGLWNR